MVFHFGQKSPNHFSTELVASPVRQRVGLRSHDQIQARSDNDVKAETQLLQPFLAG